MTGKFPTQYGRLLKEQCYLTKKHLDGTPNEDFYAPEGGLVAWHGTTNEGHEEHYGGRKLYWVQVHDLEGYLLGQIGAELGVDFEWEEEANAN